MPDYYVLIGKKTTLWGNTTTKQWLVVNLSGNIPAIKEQQEQRWADFEETWIIPSDVYHSLPAAFWQPISTGTSIGLGGK